MKRIILHWTAGSWKPNGLDINAYHLLITGDGLVVNGKFPIEANSSARGKLTKGTYAAHTLNCNTDSIGVSICAMRNAKERPFDAGDQPIKPVQLEALARLVGRLCREYGIPVTRQTVLTHAEVEPTLGIKQKQKWDIRWLPGMTKAGGAIEIGDKLRAMILAGTTKPQFNLLEAIVNFFRNLFKKGR